eukprot:2347581-Karenia_brevis.AAC.1
MLVSRIIKADEQATPRIIFATLISIQIASTSTTTAPGGRAVLSTATTTNTASTEVPADQAATTAPRVPTRHLVFMARHKERKRSLRENG